MKIFNFLMAVVFLAFAFTQTGSQYPIPGIIMFGVMAVICILAMFQVYHKWLLILMAIPIFYYAASVHISAREWVHSGGAVYHQEARFFFELVFCILVLVFQGFRSFRKG